MTRRDPLPGTWSTKIVLVPAGVREHFQAGIGARGAKLRDEWVEMFEGYSRVYPELASDRAQCALADWRVG
jgi:transketolase